MNKPPEQNHEPSRAPARTIRNHPIMFSNCNVVALRGTIGQPAISQDKTGALTASAYLTLPDELAILLRSTGAVAQTVAETPPNRYVEIIGRLAWDSTARRLVVNTTFIHTVGGAANGDEKKSIASLLATTTNTEPPEDINLYWRALNDAIEELDEETRNEISDAYRAQLEMRGFPHEPA